MKPRYVPEQKIGDRIAAEPATEGKRPARRRHVEELILHRRHDVCAEFEGVIAAQPRQRIQVLELIRVLELGKKVGRAEPAEPRAAEVAGDRDARKSARHNWIRNHPRNLRSGGRGEPKRLLHSVGPGA